MKWLEYTPEGVTLHVPISEGGWVFVWLCAVGVVLVGVLWVARANPWRHLPRLDGKPVWMSVALWLLAAPVALSLVAVGLAMLVQLLGISFGVIQHEDGSTSHEAIRNIGLAVAAIFGAPFVAWRTMVASKQAKTADESLFNDKINAASTDLAARRQVTSRITQGDKQEVLSEWQDDLVTRAAAIDRLLGLAGERPDHAPRIANMLSIYVRELSAQFPPQEPPEGAELDEWAQALNPVRSDMEKAAQTLGRLKTLPKVTPDRIEIDLRGANLQGFDLNDLTFDKARLEGAHLEGAFLWGAHLKGAILVWAHLEGANLKKAHLEGAHLEQAHLEQAHLEGAHLEGADLVRAHLEVADLTGAHLEGANLGEARLEGAILLGAHLKGANLGEARLEGAILWGAHLEGASLHRAHLEGAHLNANTSFTDASLQAASVKDVDFTGCNITQAQLETTFGDASTTLGSLTRPAHWPDSELMWVHFYAEWRDYLDNPASYLPPQNRS